MEMGRIDQKRALKRQAERSIANETVGANAAELIDTRDITVNWWVPLKGRPEAPNIRILPNGDVRFSVALLSQFGYHPHDKPRLRIGNVGRTALVFQFGEPGTAARPSALPFQINRDGKVGNRLRAMLEGMELPAGYYRPDISVASRRVVVMVEHLVDEQSPKMKIAKEITND